MTTLRAILDRFRPAAPPGRPGPVGVPSEAKFTPADELAPVFAILDSVETECSAIRTRAERDAAAIVGAAGEYAKAVEADAVGAADRQRAAVAAALRAAAQTQFAEQVNAAKQEADLIRAAGTAELDSVVAAVVDKVRAIARDTSSVTTRAMP